MPADIERNWNISLTRDVYQDDQPNRLNTSCFITSETVISMVRAGPIRDYRNGRSRHHVQTPGRAWRNTPGNSIELVCFIEVNPTCLSIH